MDEKDKEKKQTEKKEKTEKKESPALEPVPEKKIDKKDDKKALDKKEKETEKNKAKFSEEKDEFSPLTTILILILIIILFGGLAGLYYYYNSGKLKNITKSEPNGSVCIQNGITYNNGASFDSDDECNTCTCSNGEIVCTKKDCSSEKESNKTDSNNYLDTTNWKTFTSTDIEVFEGTQGVPLTTTLDWIDFEFTDEYKSFTYNYPDTWTFSDKAFYLPEDLSFKTLDQGGHLVLLSEDQSCNDIQEASDSWNELVTDAVYEVVEKKQGQILDNSYNLVIGKLNVFSSDPDAQTEYFSYDYCMDLDEEYSFFLTFNRKEQGIPDDEKVYETILSTFSVEEI